MKEGEQPEPTIIDILNMSLKMGTNEPDNYPTVEIIAERMGIDKDTLHWWLENDRDFKSGLTLVKEANDNDPWKNELDDETKLDAATLSFGVSIVLEETKKRYTA